MLMTIAQWTVITNYVMHMKKLTKRGRRDKTDVIIRFAGEKLFSFVGDASNSCAAST